MPNVNQVLEAMLEFQKKHGIKNKCVANAVYLREYLLSIGMSAKVKAVVTYHTIEEEKAQFLTCHMVVETEQGIVDPSYDISRHNAKYFDELHNIKGFMEGKTVGIASKELVSNFINFIDMADKINNKGFFITGRGRVYCDKLRYGINRMLKQ